MIVPVEVLERILLKCDGRTLLKAKQIDEEWKGIVEYLTKKSRIWEWCCKEEIPKNELLEYLDKYEKNDKDKWLNIYQNWCYWEDINNLKYDIVLSQVEVPKISCIAVSGNYVALGTEDGRIRIFNNHWDLLYAARHLAVKVTSIRFIENNINGSLDFCVIMAYNRGLVIFCFEGGLRDQLLIQDVKSFSVYQNYICYEKVGGRMTIAKITKSNGKRTIVEIWFSRIYSPNCLSTMNMWDGVCTFLINNEVKVIQYDDENISPMDIMKRKTRLKFSLQSDDSYCTQILRDDILITLYRTEDYSKGEFIEFFILGDNNQYSKKLFNTWEIFTCSITCIYVYGNTLVLGVDIGNVYLYHVSSWKNLDLREYNQKIIIGKHPIVCIDVKETENERKFYISSKFNVHEITGIRPSNKYY